MTQQCVQECIDVELVDFYEYPEDTVSLGARICYSEQEVWDIQREVDYKLIEKLKKSGHMSVLEHSNYTFVISGISRACLAQLTRHRIASFSVRSQRYVNENEFDYTVPESVGKDMDCLTEYDLLMDRIQKVYKFMVNSGIPKEDARYVLPNATHTQLMLTMNARSLINFFRLRLCKRAQWEIRAVADLMLRQLEEVSPAIFEKVGPPCIMDGECKEHNSRKED